MEFRTRIDIPMATTPLQHHEHILMLGSCFAEHISAKLQSCGFRCMSNPFGILYNPESILACLKRLLNGEPFEKSELVFHNGLYHSMLHHGSFSSASDEECLEMLNRSLQTGRKALLEADVLILTWGTAWIYEMDGHVVANCHKIPSDRFTRRRLTVEEIVASYRAFLALPEMQGKRILLTVSPIRHIKDGLHENELSKATLLLAADELVKTSNGIAKASAEAHTIADVQYFPSYEIMMDELRDYRFYADDMLHPSTTAVEYIWEQFARTQLSADARQVAAECEAFFRSKAHRPLHPDDPACKRFLEKLAEQETQLRRKYPYLQID